MDSKQDAQIRGSSGNSLRNCVPTPRELRTRKIKLLIIFVTVD